MNIKKTVAVMLCAVFAAAMLSGCVSSTTVKEKDAGEVTIFVDETIKGAITDAAAAYTKPVRELPEREKAIILIVSDSTEDIVSRVENGEYADAVFVLGDEALNARGFLRSNLRKKGTLHAKRNTSPIIMSEFITIVSQRLQKARA